MPATARAEPVLTRSGCDGIMTIPNFLYDGGIVPDPEGIITGGHDNKTARTMAVRQGEAINRRALSVMFKQIIANNRAGGWRTLKRKR